MRTLIAFVGLAVLCSFAVAEEIPTPDFVPCSFTAQFSTKLYNPQEEVVASSTDRLMRDSDLELWRWDSDFTGLAPVLEPQKWIIIWRPDNSTSYHDKGDVCVKNNGRKEMAPFPYQWLYEKTYGINWFKNSGTYEGLPCDIYHSKFVVQQYKTTMTADIYILQKNGGLVLINGTAVSKDYGLNLHYTMNVDYFEQRHEIRPSYFIPSAHCTGGVPMSAPRAASEDFVKSCYDYGESSMGVQVAASWIAVLVAALVAILM